MVRKKEKEMSLLKQLETLEGVDSTIEKAANQISEEKDAIFVRWFLEEADLLKNEWKIIQTTAYKHFTLQGKVKYPVELKNKTLRNVEHNIQRLITENNHLDLDYRTVYLDFLTIPDLINFVVLKNLDVRGINQLMQENQIQIKANESQLLETRQQHKALEHFTKVKGMPFFDVDWHGVAHGKFAPPKLVAFGKQWADTRLHLHAVFSEDGSILEKSPRGLKPFQGWIYVNEDQTGMGPRREWIETEKLSVHCPFDKLPNGLAVYHHIGDGRGELLAYRAHPRIVKDAQIMHPAPTYLAPMQETFAENMDSILFGLRDREYNGILMFRKSEYSRNAAWEAACATRDKTCSGYVLEKWHTVDFWVYISTKLQYS